MSLADVRLLNNSRGWDRIQLLVSARCEHEWRASSSQRDGPYQTV